MKVGMIGAGSIAGVMAGTLKTMGCAQPWPARDYGRAAEFAQKYGFEKACGSYEELVEDAGVELVYIATPHSHHYEHIKLCLNHGKHVLCEKSFTVNESTGQGKETAFDRGYLDPVYAHEENPGRRAAKRRHRQAIYAHGQPGLYHQRKRAYYAS